mgnify:CR=1 FL=1
MIKTARQLKDLIRNLSKKNAADAQILMRNYMMERFLERISLSSYRDKFILKGGMLVAAMVGLDARSTMDLDATVKGANVSVEDVENMMAEIIAVPIDDGVTFQVKSISEIMDEAEEPHDISHPIPLKSPRGDVLFEQVSFSYAADKPVLCNISFHVQPGQTIALVGETGAGKTTIVNLLTRFYDVDSGRITIDGVDIQAMKREELHRCFSVVLQDTCLFTGTIADNIRYGNPAASDEEVKRAAQLANAHSFISRLPQRYQTMVSGSTDNLSQGQRQLLAIARAFLSNAPILILDEATSSVDTRTEKNIQKAMLTLMQGRTSFLVAHRLSTIRDADRIMVIGEHRIMESGTHAQLMAQKSVYYKMVLSQLGLNNTSD